MRSALSSALALALVAGLVACHNDDAPDVHVDGAVTADAANPDAPPGADIAEQLAAIDGMRVVEVTNDLPKQYRLPGYRYFDLYYRQPADHAAPDGQVFEQYITLSHRDVTAPMVLHTHGYGVGFGYYLTEPARLTQGNQLTVEHRFFGQSRPDPADWSKLTVRQESDDLHRIVTALKPIYGAKWISTGASKNGETSLMFRRFYPDDVDGTVAYVAPLLKELFDPRYLTVLDSVGTAECRDKLRAFLRAALLHRTAMEEHTIAAYGADAFSAYTVPHAVETAILEGEFAFWQYTGIDGCASIPAADATDDELFTELESINSLDGYGDGTLRYYEPYYFQVMAELGYIAIKYEHLTDLLQYDYEKLDDWLVDAPAPAAYDPTTINQALDWIAHDGDGLMLVYGQWDPWTAGQVDLGDATDSARYYVPEVGHWASIEQLEPADRDAALATLSRWSGVQASFPALRSRRAIRDDQRAGWHGGLRPSR